MAISTFETLPHFPSVSIPPWYAEEGASISINGTGSAKVWWPCTPAMAAGLTDHVWSLKEVLLYPVPPWPQSQTV